jgi:hypothetical protein
MADLLDNHRQWIISIQCLTNYCHRESCTLVQGEKSLHLITLARTSPAALGR